VGQIALEHRDVSKNLFGSSHMLAVMATIGRAEDGRFSAPQVSGATGLPASTIHNLITRLIRAGLVRRTGEVTPDRVAMYERRPSLVWETAVAIEGEADALQSGTITDLWDQRA